MASDDNFDVIFLDHEREPKCAPNSDYPNGMDVDMSRKAKKVCFILLPYPAPRCGVMVVACKKCGLSNGLTVAGRPDDARSVLVACKLN